jgi:hypothetical protein
LGWSRIKRLVEHLIQLALRKNKSRRVGAIAVIQEDGSGHKLRDRYQAYQQDDGGEQHLEDAEAPLPLAKLCE